MEQLNLKPLSVNQNALNGIRNCKSENLDKQMLFESKLDGQMVSSMFGMAHQSSKE